MPHKWSHLQMMWSHRKQRRKKKKSYTRSTDWYNAKVLREHWLLLTLCTLVHHFYPDVLSSWYLSRKKVWGAGFEGGVVMETVLIDAGTGGGFSSSVYTWNMKQELIERQIWQKDPGTFYRNMFYYHTVQMHNKKHYMNKSIERFGDLLWEQLESPPELSSPVSVSRGTP